MKKCVKVILLSVIILVVNVLIFSDFFIGLKMFADSTFITALGITEIILSVVSFFYFFFKIVNEEKKVNINVEELQSQVDYVKALKEISETKPYLTEIVNKVFEQLDMFYKKSEVLEKVLRLKNIKLKDFYLNEAEKVRVILLENIKKFLVRVIVLDKKSALDKTKPINISINKILESNEDIIEKFDTFVQETSMYGDNDTSDYNTVSLDAAIDALRQLRSPANDFFDNY